FPFPLLQPRSRTMSLFSFLGVLKAVHRKSRASPPGRQRGYRYPGVRFVPRLLELECRTLPSTLTVSNNADSGSGSLRDTHATAMMIDTITLDASLKDQTITLTSGELVIDKSLDIEGLGANHLAVSGNDASRVFDITSGGLTVTLAELALVHGRASQGAGIDNA